MKKDKFLMFALLFILIVVSLFTGVSELSLADLYSDGQINHDAWQLMLVSRLPRTLAAVLVGAGLAISGLLMQTMVQNKFVEPTTAGSGQSAALGILLTTVFLPDISLSLKIVLATLTSLAGTAVFLQVSRRLNPAEPVLVPLFGLIYGGIVGSLVTFFAYQYDMIQYIAVWTSGEFSGVLRGRYELLWLIGLFVIIAWWTADKFTILAMGLESSIGLGLNYQRLQQLGLIIVCVIAALTVVIVGMIPFVGLIIPNIVSRMKGDNLKNSLPWVAFGGSVFVLGCDILARVIRYPYEVPVATIIGVLGALIFILLLIYKPGSASNLLSFTAGRLKNNKPAKHQP